MNRAMTLFLLLMHLSVQAQDGKPYLPQYPDSLRKGRAIALGSTTGVLLAGTIIGLNELWYAQEPRSAFHSFNDGLEWNQMDKGGHVITCYSIGYYYSGLMRNCGIDRNLSIGLGGSVGSIYNLGIEILDGFSSEWGFSWTDFAANSLGTGFFIGQQFLWDEQRIKLKISWHQSGLARYRPDLLGSNFPEQMMKDYNGHTYWMSLNVHSFIKNPPRLFPRWANVAIGYGADGLLGGHNNPKYNDAGELLPELQRTRQFYLSLDVDLTRIRTRKRWLRTIFQAVALIKFPFPAMEVNTAGQVRFHPFYF